MNSEYKIGQRVRSSNEERSGRVIRIASQANRYFYDVEYHGGCVVNRIPGRTLLPVEDEV